MRLGVIAQIRDEADILPIFLGNLLPLFDHALFLDHGSTDGTSQLLETACAEHAGWRRWQVNVPGHHQGPFALFALRDMFDNTECDHVFILDCDEFLDVQDRADLEARVTQLRDPLDVGQFFWKNCVPARFDGGFVHDGVVWVPETRSRLGKVFVTRAFYEASAGQPVLVTGNHLATAPDGAPANHIDLGRILHVPIRSAAQLSRKAIVGTLNNMLRLDRHENEGFHWRDIVSQISANGLTDDDLTTLAVNYSNETTRLRSRLADLSHSGFTKQRIKGSCAAVIPSPDPWQVIAKVIAGWRPLDGSTLELELRGTQLGLRA